MPPTFPSRRSVVMAQNGIVATSQPLAAQAGLDILKAGGNAADAAVATAAMLNVVEPMSTGIGGDMFALVYDAKSGCVSALNGSGRSPYAANIDILRQRGHKTIPLRGILPVTVPGAVAGWNDLLEAHGSMSMGRVLQPAIAYARDGFPVSEIIAGYWRSAVPKLAADPAAAATYLPSGTRRRPARYSACQTWRTPSNNSPRAAAMPSTEVRSPAGSSSTPGRVAGSSIWPTLPTTHRPGPSQSASTTAAYASMSAHPTGRGWWRYWRSTCCKKIICQIWAIMSADYAHLLIEALKLAFADGYRHVADPEQSPAPLSELLSPAHARASRAKIDMRHAALGPSFDYGSDTVYLTVVDKDRNAVSFINSLYMGFGSGVVVPGTGICLQNRGALFSLTPGHANALAPHKRPYHTIIPAMATRNGKLLMSFGVMGGFMQPQGHLQVVINMIDFGMDPQQALNAPRLRFDDGYKASCGEPPHSQGRCRSTLSRPRSHGHQRIPGLRRRPDHRCPPGEWGLDGWL